MRWLSLVFFVSLFRQAMAFVVPPLRSTSSFATLNRPQQKPLLIPTILASSSSLEEMDREALLEYLNGDTLGLSFQDYLKREQQLHYLQNCPIFNKVAPADCDRVAACMEEIQVPKGTTLIQEGDETGNSMYFLVQGKLTATKNSTVLITYQHPGDFFGELALIFKGQARQASIVASEASTVYKLDKTAFRESMQDSPVFDTARKMLLKKYSSTRLLKTLPKIQLNEIRELLTAKLQFKKDIANSLFSFAMGASFTLLVSIWSGGVRDPHTGWPMLFSFASLTKHSPGSSALPVQFISMILVITAIVGHLSIPKDERPTVTINQKLKRSLHKAGVVTIVLLWIKGISNKAKIGESSVMVFLSLQLLISIVLDSTRGTSVSSPIGDDQGQAVRQTSKSRRLLTMVSSAVLGYEVLRGLVGALG